ncbi:MULTISPECIES: metallophosphoesterase [Rheinheimera]|uniref:Metallophosphoesterase n=1 Tax=Rheinheimera marina TaxID=1774958 RepID=A0ABV9JQD0_9GAMM
MTFSGSFRLSALALMLTASLTSFSSAANTVSTQQPLQVAFMPDAHFHDVYAKFTDHSFRGIQDEQSGQFATIRTMAAQLHSTRLFNENYFALKAALDDAARRQVKLVVLPGDFSDDGQPVHLRGLKQLLQQYEQQHGMKFFLTLGNHDPVRPFASAGGKDDFLGSDARPQPIYSPDSAECQSASKPARLICSAELGHLGYSGVLELLGNYGFYPSSSDLYWESPYSQGDQQPYQYSTAKTQSALQHRQYQVCANQSSANQRSDASVCELVPDASYLVEPVPGLWLLAIDANIYTPSLKDGTLVYAGSGNAGYNELLSYKPQLVPWIRSVVSRAKAQGKTLLSFSHFPMAEFYQGQSAAIEQLFGEAKGQLSRVPLAPTSALLADTGLRLHVAGHMHLNNTAAVPAKDGGQLVNIQAPSLAAYVPAYKLLTLAGAGKAQVDTIVLQQVPDFSALFGFYQREWQQLKQHGEPLWDIGLLQAKNYRDFTKGHLQELTRLRFLPQDWPEQLRTLLLQLNAGQMLLLASEPGELSLADYLNNPATLTALLQQPAYQARARLLQQQASAAGQDWAELSQISGFEVAVDFYRLQNAGDLAIADIGERRLARYRWLAEQLGAAPTVVSRDWQQLSLQHYSQQHFALLFAILNGFQHGLPNRHFSVDLQSGALLKD